MKFRMLARYSCKRRIGTSLARKNRCSISAVRFLASALTSSERLRVSCRNCPSRAEVSKTALNDRNSASSQRACSASSQSLIVTFSRASRSTRKLANCSRCWASTCCMFSDIWSSSAEIFSAPLLKRSRKPCTSRSSRCRGRMRGVESIMMCDLTFFVERL